MDADQAREVMVNAWMKTIRDKAIRGLNSVFIAGPSKHLLKILIERGFEIEHVVTGGITVSW